MGCDVKPGWDMGLAWSSIISITCGIKQRPLTGRHTGRSTVGLSDRTYEDVIGNMGLSIDMILGHRNLQEQHCFTSARYVHCCRYINWFF